MKVLVIGAGVAGLTCAAELHKSGFAVHIVEHAPEIGQKACSWFAGGMFAPWCEGESAEEPVVRLGQKALDWWEGHVDCVERQGTLVLSHKRDVSELQRFARRTDHFEIVHQNRIRELEPDISEGFMNGLFFAGEGHLNPRNALIQLASKLRSKGINITLDTNYTAVQYQAEFAADYVFDCRGLSARDDLKDLRGVKGEMLIIRSHDITLQRPVRLLHPRIPLYIVPYGEGIFMLGATMLESDAGHHISLRSTLELLSAAYAFHPALGEAEILETGVAARPAFPDNLPHIRRNGNKFYLNGLYRHGFLLAPAMATMAVQALQNPDYIPELMDKKI